MNNWFSIKTQLEDMKKNYIPYREYENMCEKEDITDELSQKTLIGFLHDLGIVLHFSDHPILEYINVLNLEWVTKGVYQILNSNLLFQTKGMLEIKALSHILDPEAYPKEHHIFIMEMMRKFELGFNFVEHANERFLIPDLLSKEESDTGEWGDSLAFQYHYDVLPGSIISRFIVRTHSYISKNTYWRYGVVLVSEDEKNKALVKADIEDRKIFINVKGSERTCRTFLSIIRCDFRKIHASISKLKVKEKVPLPEYPEMVVDYKHLLNLESLGEINYIPEGMSKRVNVKQLLDGIEERKPQYRPKPLLPPAPDEHNKEELSELIELVKNKTTLDLDAQKYAKRIIWSSFGALAALWTVLGIMTWKIGWDTMEPWTFFVGVSLTLLGYGYFAFTNNVWSPKAIYNQILEKRKKKNYEVSNFDLKKYERIMSTVQNKEDVINRGQ